VDGIPYYLKSSLPPEALASLNTPGTPEEAADVVARQIAAGADMVKLFTGSWVERGRVLPMPAEIARAAAEEAHRRGKLVFAHASSIAGLELAMEAGVDVVAHALDDDRGWDPSYADRMKAQGMALVPTLKLFGGRPYTGFIQEEVRDYARAGGQILFGTDVGYLTDYDPREEYVLMSGAGLDWRQILASLTTAPSERFGELGRRGRIAPGMDADLVVLARDPSLDVKAFADVVYSFRGGRVVFENRNAVRPQGADSRSVFRVWKTR
jgi:imidazolonepropionase-like amidohydrolase